MKAIIILCILYTSLTFSQECQKKQVEENYQSAISTLTTKADKLEKIIGGENIGDFSLQDVFGLDFKIEQTPQRILKLENILSSDAPVSVEHQNLYKCLVDFQKIDSKEKLVKLSGLYINLKIELLKKNNLLDDSLRQTDLTGTSLPQIKEQINQENTSALKLKKELENDLIKSESQKNTTDTKLEGYKTEFTKQKIELLDKKLSTNRDLEEKIIAFEKFSEKLKQFSKEIESDNQDVLEANFLAIEKLWLEIAKENYIDLFWTSKRFEIKSIPIVPTEYEKTDLVVQYNELVELRKEILREYTEKKNQQLKLLNQLVTNGSSMRAAYYRALGLSYFFKSLGSLKTFELIKNEVSTAPYRVISYFYKKYLYVSEQLSLGREGYVKLSAHMAIILLIIILLYSLMHFFKKLSLKMDDVVRQLMSQFRRFYLVQKFYGLWSKIKENTESILWILTLEFFKSVEYFDDLYLLIWGIQVYVGASILENLVTVFLGAISKLDTSNFANFKARAAETSKKFKNIFLFYFLALIIIEATVGRVYLYTLVYFIVLIYTLYQLIMECSKWEDELRKYAERRFAGAIVERYSKLISILPSRLNAVLMFGFILSFQFFNIFVSLTENFEISKKVSANLFKKQIEKVEASEGADEAIPTEYKESFSPKSLDNQEEYVESAQKLEPRILDEINEWVEGRTEEHSLVIFGDKGIGKTTLLKHIEFELSQNEELELKYIKIPSKTVEKSSLHKLVQKIFNFEEESFNIYNIDKKCSKKTVVFLDECQNIFLSKAGGFDAYHGLLNLINMNTDNIYWVMSFNKYSWLFLDRAFGRTQFVRNVFEVSGWSDNKIKELILKRHSKTNFKLSYDLLISATRSQDEIDKYSSVESKFFKLLWELSRGNPRAALYLWLSALSRRNLSTFNVHVPRGAEIEGVERLSDELLFVISGVLKHENLTASELENVTNLQRGLIRNALKIGMERHFLFRDDRSRFMVDITTQYALIKYLRTKNFIYGS